VCFVGVIGFNDEIYDLKALAPSSGCVVVATNSAQVRVMQVLPRAAPPASAAAASGSASASSSTGGGGAELLTGHRHIVVTVDVSSDGNWIATGSKDHTLRIWRTPAFASASSASASASASSDASADWSSNQWCAAVGEGHSDAVGAVRFCRLTPVRLLVTPLLCCCWCCWLRRPP
jgi:U3 small nucleolar RNA-associated protein 13